MKIITLNIWGGRLRKPLLDFITRNQDVDIFCFQEVFDKADNLDWDYLEDGDSLNIFNDIQNVLPNHNGYFEPQLSSSYGMSMFIAKSVEILGINDGLIFDARTIFSDRASRKIQSVSCLQGGKKIQISHIHGWHQGEGKNDSSERLTQSQNIIDFVKKEEFSIVLCGDFNLNPDTQSIKMLEDIPLKNLIKEYGIMDTRTSYYKKENRFADYIFIDPSIEVKEFKVLSDQVSDHAPLYLEI